MVDTTILDKINLIFKFIKDNSLIFMILLLVLVILLDFLYGKNKKETKILYLVVISLILIYGLFTYYKPLLNILDVYTTYKVKITYFPSIIEYFTMIILTIILQIVSVKKFNNIHKNINLWVGFLLEILFITNLIAMNNITLDLNNITSIYENDLLLSIFQTSSIIFIIWIVLNIIILIINRLTKNSIEIPKLNDNYE